jgi:hypothetical protein
VDDMAAPFGRLIMCHMIADTPAELLDMAVKINVATRWIQYAGTYREHFDICKAKRALAIHHGAVAVTMRTLAGKIIARRELARIATPTVSQS